MREIQKLKPGDIVDDLQCICKVKDKKNKNLYKYRMKCLICGREKDMLSSTIRHHCGTKHKACGKGLKTKNRIFYSRWENMRTRTTNDLYHGSKHYKEKGINSNEFKYFIDFYDAMYDSFKKVADIIGPENTSLERLDNNKSYSKENCIWIHKKDQPKNVSTIVHFLVEFPDGKIEEHKNVREFALKNGLDANTILDCMNPKRGTSQHKGYKFTRL